MMAGKRPSRANFYEDRRTTGSPIQYRNGREWENFPIRFAWHTGLWFHLFERHASRIIADIQRERAQQKRILYISGPINGRNGAFTGTNIAILRSVERRLQREWGEDRFWVLNPAEYQMETVRGVGLIQEHAQWLALQWDLSEEIDLDRLSREVSIIGGDYLRMWTRVLLEDGKDNLGGHIDAIHFVGADDVRRFFLENEFREEEYRREGPIHRAIWQYVSRRFQLSNSSFRRHMIEIGGGDPSKRDGGDAFDVEEATDKFIDAYTLRPGMQSSRGQRDEFNIWARLNQLRIKHYGIHAMIPGYHDGRFLGVENMNAAVPPGYEVT